jgi:hypothetical protein
MSKVEPWQGAQEAAGPVVGQRGLRTRRELVAGEQPRCEQMPTVTKTSGLIERYSLRAYGRRQLVDLALRLRVGQLRIELGQRRQLLGRADATTHTGLPRHSDGHLLARLQRADVDLDRGTGGTRPLGGSNELTKARRQTRAHYTHSSTR